MEPSPVHRSHSAPALPLSTDAVERLKLVSTIVGSVLVHLSLGSFHSSGNMIPYVVSYVRMRSTPANLQYGDSVWLWGAFNVGFGTGPIVGGMLVSRIGHKWTAAVGELIMSCGLAATYYTVQAGFYWLVLTNGFLCGFGIGVSYTSPLQLSMQWLPKRTGLVTGIIVSGSGGSLLIFNSMQTAFLNPDNLPASPDYQNFTAAGVPSFTSLQATPEMYFKDVDILNRVPISFLLHAGVSASLQIVGTLMLFSPRTDRSSSQPSSQSECTRKETRLLLASDVGGTQQSEFMRPLEVIRTHTFVTLWLTFACNFIVITFVMALYKAFGLGIVNDDRALAWLGTITAVFNASGRIMWGLLADKTSYKAAMLGVCGSMTLLTATMYFTQHAAKEMFYVWICAMFLCFSGSYVLFPLIVAQEFGKERLTVNYSLILTCRVVAGIVGGLLSDNLSNVIGLVGVFELSAGFSTAAFLLTLTLHWRPAVCCRRLSDRRCCFLRNSSSAAS